jgi:hypothetical protein
MGYISQASTKSLLLAGVLTLASLHITTTAACEAHNDVGETCKTNCKQGETEHCANMPNASKPICECVPKKSQTDTTHVLPRMDVTTSGHSGGTPAK